MAKVFYFVGASGAGKDSVLDQFKQQLPDNMPIHIAQRYITRPTDYGGERHTALSEQDFSLRLSRGDFIMHWQANGYSYGVDCTITDYLSQGVSVLFNGSREQIPQAKSVFKEQLQVISLQVDNHVLEQRLRARGRESTDVITARLARNKTLQANTEQQAWLLDNNGPLQATVQSLMHYLQKQVESSRDNRCS